MTTQPTYGIWAEIYGGTLGYRCEWLKANGEMLRYDTRDEAVAEATRLALERNGNPNRTATFRYTARVLPFEPRLVPDDLLERTAAASDEQVIKYVDSEKWCR
jgi:hypothetical protein